MRTRLDATMKLNEVLDAYRCCAGIDDPSSQRSVVLHELERLRGAAWLEKALRAGDVAPDFALPDSDEPQLHLSDLLRDGPIVLKFYRGRWCPFCTLELRAYQRRLPEFRALGAELLALSPQNEQETAYNRDRDRLGFPMLTDVGNRIARQFGIAYEVCDEVRGLLESFGMDLSATNAGSSWTIPLPAVYLIAQDRRIAWAHVDPDYLHRAEPETVLAELGRLQRP